jgi:hypothetical protein
MSEEFGEFIVLQVPHRGDPWCWSGYGRESYLRRVYASTRYSAYGIIYDRSTPAELAQCNYGLSREDPPEEYNEAEAGWLFELAQKYGWDTPIYCAAYLTGEDQYTTEPIDELDAVIACDSRDCSYYRLITSEEQFREIYRELTGPNAPRTGQCGPLVAADALRAAAEEIGWTL